MCLNVWQDSSDALQLPPDEGHGHLSSDPQLPGSRSVPALSDAGIRSGRAHLCRNGPEAHLLQRDQVKRFKKGI